MKDFSKEFISESKCSMNILFHNDNQAVVAILNKKTSKSERVMALVRNFVLFTLKHNILSRAKYVEGVMLYRQVTDYLSSPLANTPEPIFPENICQNLYLTPLHYRHRIQWSH
jgi:hypothetical protein